MILERLKYQIPNRNRGTIVWVAVGGEETRLMPKEEDEKRVKEEDQHIYQTQQQDTSSSSSSPISDGVSARPSAGTLPLPLLFLFLLCFNFGIYYNSLYNGFAFDDYLGIVNNPDINAQAVPFHDIFRHDLWGKHLLKIDSNR